MNKTKKILLVVFATIIVMNMQFNTPLSKGMDNGFSIEQLADTFFSSSLIFLFWRVKLKTSYNFFNTLYKVIL